MTATKRVPVSPLRRRFFRLVSWRYDEAGGGGRSVTPVALVPILLRFLQPRRVVAQIGRPVTQVGQPPFSPAFAPDVCADACARRPERFPDLLPGAPSPAGRVVGVDIACCTFFAFSRPTVPARTIADTHRSAGECASRVLESSLNVGALVKARLFAEGAA